jgi:hypothetical protein
VGLTAERMRGADNRSERYIQNQIVLTRFSGLDPLFRPRSERYIQNQIVLTRFSGLLTRFSGLDPPPTDPAEEPKLESSGAALDAAGDGRVSRAEVVDYPPRV